MLVVSCRGHWQPLLQPKCMLPTVLSLQMIHTLSASGKHCSSKLQVNRVSDTKHKTLFPQLHQSSTAIPISICFLRPYRLAWFFVCRLHQCTASWPCYQHSFRWSKHQISQIMVVVTKAISNMATQEVFQCVSNSITQTVGSAAQQQFHSGFFSGFVLIFFFVFFRKTGFSSLRTFFKPDFRRLTGKVLALQAQFQENPSRNVRVTSI